MRHQRHLLLRRLRGLGLHDNHIVGGGLPSTPPRGSSPRAPNSQGTPKAFQPTRKERRRLLVIERTGRRSGTHYRTPVNYAIVGDDLYCVAAFGERTDWYRNLLTTPHIAVWLPDGRWEASVADVSDDPRRVDLLRSVLIDSGFAAHLFGLHARHIGDEDLAKATAAYRLLRIRPLQRRTAPNGPGDLAWLWFPLGAAIIIGGLRRRSRPGPIGGP